MRITRFMDFLADVDTRYKMIFVVFVMAVLPAGAFLFLLNAYSSREIISYAALYLALLMMVQFPAATFLSNLLVLRNIKKINVYCQKVKQGLYHVSFDLPPEKGDEDDFLRLKRNFYQMGRIIARREQKLIGTLQELQSAQEKIVESIEYAALIQNSVLPSPQVLHEAFRDHFIWWEPRDVVGGDTYWVTKSGEGFFAGVIDCTGHGVPGAFVTLIVHTLLEKILSPGFSNPASVLQYMNQQIKAFLGRNNSLPLVDDGFEAALCFIEPGRDKVVFAGAGLPLFHEHDGRIHEIRGDRAGVGYSRVAADTVYTNHSIDLYPGMRFYLATDGIMDQIGGSKRLPFGKKRLMRLLAEIHSRPLSKQQMLLAESLKAYTGDEDRRDDLTILGFVPRI